ncbi:hypothetical protein D1872_208010 [compost metagenome]
MAAQLNKDKKKEKKLQELHEYLAGYKINVGGSPSGALSDREKAEYSRLATELRNTGWSLGIGYSSDWQAFSNKVDILRGHSTHQ